MAKHGLDTIDIFHDHGVYLPSRTIFLCRADYLDGEEGDPGVDHVFATKFMKNLHVLESMSSDPITVILSTPGGMEVSGMAIYDAIKSSPCHTTMIVRGEACSMGSYILQAADERLMAVHSIMMLHVGSSNGYGLDHKTSAKNWMKFEETYGKKLDAILKEKIIQKKPEYLGKKFDELMNFDTILSAQEAVDMGLADAVINNGEE